MLRPLLIALQFLTRLPIRFNDVSNSRDIGRSLLFYPLVGGLIGALIAGIALLSANIAEGIRAALVLAAWVLVTGMLHLDGLGDSADGWLGGHGDRDRTLAIMKDPRTGTAGVVMIFLVLLLKYNAIVAAITQGEIEALVLVPLLARASVPLLFLTTPYVRPGGLGETLARHAPRSAALFIIAASVGLTIADLRWSGVAMVFSATLTFLLLRKLMMQRIGGATGDTAGAMIEIVETVALVTVAFFA